MTPAQVADELQRRAKALRAAIEKAERESAEEGVQIARALSSGGLSRQSARRADYPYAKRHGRARLNAAIINRIEGNFWAAWKRSGGFWQGGKHTAHIINDAPQAEFLDTAQRPAGTRFMVARPVREAVISKLQPGRLRRLREAIAEVWK